MNQADAQIIRKVLERHNHEFTDLKSSDLVVINSCSVKLTTENRMISRIKKYLGMGKRVIVAGCLPRMNPKRLQNLNVSVVDTDSLDGLPRVVKLDGDGRRFFFSNKHKNKLRLPHAQDDSVTGIVSISEGCLSQCSFCGTRNARGRLMSYPIRDILEYTRCLIDQGKREIFITAQDVGCYGIDIKTNLIELLEKITSLEGDFWLRIGMMSPHHVQGMFEKLIEIYRSDKIYKFLHIPIQSGSNNVLKSMRRAGSAEQFLSMVRRFREEIPNIAVSTDIIVGFPTETDADFEKTVNLIKKARPDITNISMFYPRPRTEASKMKKLPTETIKQRSRRLSEICRKISLENNKKYIGREMRCLVTGQSKYGQVLARAPNFKQVILDSGDAVKDGRWVDVRIVDVGSSHLKGFIPKK